MSKPDGKKPGKPAKPRSTNVPGSYRGFSLQVNRFVYHLMCCGPSDTVSLEAFEDVGVEFDSGERLAEQTKSHLSKNPLADRSPEMWKTLANWATAALAGTLPADTTRFVIYAHSTGMGEVAAALHGANDDESARAALTFCKSHLSYPDGLSEHEATRRHMHCVLSSDEDVVLPIIRRLSIEVGTPSGLDELQTVFDAQPIGPDNIEAVIQWSLGWVKKRLDEQVSRGEAGRIRRDEFHTALTTFVRHYDRENILRSIAGVPSPASIAEERQLRTYVRQLRCIDLDDDDVLGAINDYLRAAVDRTVWSENGHVDAESLELFASELVTTWRNKRLAVSIRNKHDPKTERGQALYVDCVLHLARLGGMETPEHFVRGSWHALADAEEIGWHPDYKSLLAANIELQEQ